MERGLKQDVARRHLFAISGVSGGSVGALAYAAHLAGGPQPTVALAQDFLAPAIAAMAFVDGPSTFIWEHDGADRGVALERAWEAASQGRLAQPFLDLFPSQAALAATPPPPWRPALLLNATHQATGRRLIVGHLQAESHVFLDSFDAHDLLRADMPASTAGHNSARFSYVSPAGKLVPRWERIDASAQAETADRPKPVGYVLDGGYFENFGALTAVQLAREVDRALGRDRVRPIVVQISSDPSLWERDRARQLAGPPCAPAPGSTFLPYKDGESIGPRYQERDGNSGWFATYMNQLTAPFAGLTASRVAHGTVAAMELANWACRREPAVPAAKRDGVPSGGGRSDLVANVADAPADKPVAPRSAPLTMGSADEPAAVFVHLGMCDGLKDTVPPLGWVLSNKMRLEIAGRLADDGAIDRPGILDKECGNPQEWKRLLAAFG
jgi:hypothetical protein